MFLLVACYCTAPALALLVLLPGCCGLVAGPAADGFLTVNGARVEASCAPAAEPHYRYYEGEEARFECHRVAGTHSILSYSVADAAAEAEAEAEPPAARAQPVLRATRRLHAADRGARLACLLLDVRGRGAPCALALTLLPGAPGAAAGRVWGPALGAAAALLLAALLLWAWAAYRSRPREQRRGALRLGRDSADEPGPAASARSADCPPARGHAAGGSDEGAPPQGRPAAPPREPL